MICNCTGKCKKFPYNCYNGYDMDYYNDYGRNMSRFKTIEDFSFPNEEKSSRKKKLTKTSTSVIKD